MAKAPRGLRPEALGLRPTESTSGWAKLARLKTPNNLEANEVWLDVSRNLIENLAGGL